MFDKFKKIIYSRNNEKDCGNDQIDQSRNTGLPSEREKLDDKEKSKIKKVMQLTPREYDVYLLLLEGYTLKECADKLSIKYSTANTHMTGVYKKLGINTKAELIINYRDIKIEEEM
jgi:DNA-binding CsgD family transcriptional regulator